MLHQEHRCYNLTPDLTYPRQQQKQQVDANTIAQLRSVLENMDMILTLTLTLTLTLNLLNSSNNHDGCNAVYGTITRNLSITCIQHRSPYHSNHIIKPFHYLNFVTLPILAITCD